MFKCLNECQVRMLQLQDKLALAEYEADFWKDQWELSEHKSRQKDILILNRNYVNRIQIPIV